MSGALLFLLVGVQPWLSWPSLHPDTSHRLTLFACAIAMGLWQLSKPKTVPLPRSWVWWALALIAAMSYSVREAFWTGDYFRFFQETAVMSNGVAVACAALFGVWALTQQTPEAFRRMRWVGLAVLEASLLWSVAQAWCGQHYATGILGVDRLNAAYAVAWLPICWTWHPLASALPVGILWLSHKPLVLLAVPFALWPVVGKAAKRWLLVGALVGVVSFGIPSALWLKVSARTLTWWHALQASGQHPFVGYGFSPMVLNLIRQEHGYVLPSLHSDWLMLVVGAGWVVAGWALWLWWRVVCAVPRSRWAAACQGSLLGIGVLSAVQSTVSHARVGGLLLVLLAWWVVEQRTREEQHA